MINKAIFLDKDGTLINDIPYNINTDLITLSKNSIKGLQQLQQAGYLLIVVSNQSGIAHGYFEKGDLVSVKVKLQELLSNYNINLNGFYYCPHFQDGQIKEYAFACDCRKPKPGMLIRAAHEMSIDLTTSWMIGDILNDVEAGNSAGCKTILINNGNETEWLSGLNRTPEFTCTYINEAANFILSINET